jgi:DNA helicase IV
MRNTTFLALSQEQQDLLLEMPFEGRHLVSGPPGSGKTLLAVYRAAMLATAGRDVVLLTHSNALRQYAEEIARSLLYGGRVATCHRWFQEFWSQRFSEEPPVLDDGVGLDWTEMLARLNRSTSQTAGAIDCLVVDEGQDLHNFCYALCGDLAGCVTVFVDENQRIGDNQSTLREIQGLLGSDTVHLRTNTNHRNTRQVWELAKLFHCGDPATMPTAPDREGPRPSLRHDSSPRELAATIAGHALGHRELDIGVILPRQHQLVPMLDALRHRGVRNTQVYVGEGVHFRELNYARRGVKIFTPVSAKGQEFDTVFVPHLESYTGDTTGAALRMQLYVMTTRARNELHLSYGTAREPEIVGDIPDSILARS